MISNILTVLNVYQ